MKGKIKLPPTKYQDHEVDINLRIYQNGSKYGLDIQAMGQMHRGIIDMTQDDLLELNKQLQQAMNLMARNNQKELPTQQELSNFAEVGHYAFNQIFCHSSVKYAIESLIGLNKKASIEIASESFFLPWEFIYSESLDKPFSYNNFWGMNHLISRIIIQDYRLGGFISPEINIRICPKLGMLTYRKLDGVVEGELKFFQHLNSKGKIKLFLLRSLDPCRKSEEFKEFKSFWSNTLDIAHFACHSDYDSEFPNQSYILLSDDFPITIRELKTHEIVIEGNPLIIINACRGGQVNPLYTSSFAATFLKHGARGVVATECAIPDMFAASFAEQLYKHFLTGMPLGECLFIARKYFLEKHKNPSGLLYSMYASPSIRLVQT